MNGSFSYPIKDNFVVHRWPNVFNKVFDKMNKTNVCHPARIACGFCCVQWSSIQKIILEANSVNKIHH